jgi:hypothetical protein
VPDAKLTDLTAQTDPIADTDVAYVVDVSDTTDDPAGTSKRATIAQLRQAIGGYSTLVSVNFGTKGDIARATVTGLTWLTTDYRFGCQVVPNATHGAEDILIEQVEATIDNIVAGTGFDVVAHAPNGTGGVYAVHVQMTKTTGS